MNTTLACILLMSDKCDSPSALDRGGTCQRNHTERQPRQLSGSGFSVECGLRSAVEVVPRELGTTLWPALHRFEAEALQLRVGRLSGSGRRLQRRDCGFLGRRHDILLGETRKLQGCRLQHGHPHRHRYVLAKT